MEKPQRKLNRFTILAPTKCRKKVLAGNQTGEITQIDIGTCKPDQIVVPRRAAISQIKSVGQNEILACFKNGNIFYGSMGGNGSEGIKIKHSREIFDADVSGTYIVGGSEHGEICESYMGVNMGWSGWGLLEGQGAVFGWFG